VDTKNNIQYGILHNRKTAGTALKDVIAQQLERTPHMPVKCFDHAMTLPKFIQAYPSTKAIFFVREPISRFVSGFYSRLREGKPRYHYPWSRAEARAFKRFNHPNVLAEALSSWNPIRRFQAISAMKSIGHVRHRYEDFLGTLSFLEKSSDKIAFIGHQKDFASDLERLRVLLSVDADILAPQDETKAHRNPKELDTQLSELAILNLQKWYKNDIEIYWWCLGRRDQII
jgi:hypothetical protein